MRRRRNDDPENHERWLVSYADFITLLFAFFVVMFASTQADKSKAQAVSESVREALEHGQLSAAFSTVLGRGKHENSRPETNPDRVEHSENLPPKPPPADLAKSLDKLQQALVNELLAGQVQLRLEGRGLVISLREAGFFASGDDTVAPAGIPVLQKIVSEIAPTSNQLRVEGYTDSVPIHTARFPSNWELSTARAIAMLEILQQRFQISPTRLAAVGYAENAPVDSNDTEEGRAHNRRVELVVMSVEAMKVDPSGTPRAH
jgi:chemotaxis protein MotB